MRKEKLVPLEERLTHLEVSELQRGGRRRDDVRRVPQRPRRLLLTLGRDDLGPGLPCGLGLRRHRPLQLHRQTDVLAAKIFIRPAGDCPLDKLTLHVTHIFPFHVVSSLLASLLFSSPFTHIFLLILSSLPSSFPFRLRSICIQYSLLIVLQPA